MKKPIVIDYVLLYLEAKVVLSGVKPSAWLVATSLANKSVGKEWKHKGWAAKQVIQDGKINYIQDHEA